MELPKMLKNIVNNNTFAHILFQILSMSYYKCVHEKVCREFVPSGTHSSQEIFSKFM